MRHVLQLAAALALLPLAQPAAAALVTLDFTGEIGPLVTPATLAGGDFDGSITFDDATFPGQPATLEVTSGPLANTYVFGGQPGAFIPAAYQVTFTSTTFQFQGTSDEGFVVTFDFDGAGGVYAGNFAVSRGSDVSAVGDARTGAPVPEPAAWAMMIAGLGTAGAALRRRRSAPAAA